MKRIIVGLLLVVVGVTGIVSLAEAAPASIAVADTTYGSTSTATVLGGGNAEYVYVQCWAPDLAGEYVFAAYYEIVDGSAVVGPFATGSTWSTSRPADCRAEAGFFKAQGFGDWKRVTNSTVFHVSG